MTLSTAEAVTGPSRGPVLGLAAQLSLLALLGSTLSLTAGGLVAGAAYGLVLCGLLGAGLGRAGMTRLGAANAVTLSRAILAGGVTAMVVTSFTDPVNTAVLVTIAAVALALDGVDGQVARRTNTATALGARFDMEVDSFLVLVLSVYAGDHYGWWWVAIGAFRYVFVAASWAWPWLNAPLPPRFSRKIPAVVQGVGLVVAMAGFLPVPVTVAGLALAVATPAWSFGLDIRWLYRAMRVREAARSRWATDPAPARHPALAH
ncbi:CDP-alcohol phosphatidyltransferase family protein [Actinoplanes sp. NPDC048988]|uniref:CDP-alcohol phosphatidyltransferase family protein n=1 Tax=Actinoplanes sp. NPDC048988 TaxID=3363901 RepID=UPI0037134A59